MRSRDELMDDPLRYLSEDFGTEYELSLTACNDTVDQWFPPAKEVLIKHLSPVVSMKYQFILEEIDVGSLVPTRALLRSGGKVRCA